MQATIAKPVNCTNSGIFDADGRWLAIASLNEKNEPVLFWAGDDVRETINEAINQFKPVAGTPAGRIA